MHAASPDLERRLHVLQQLSQRIEQHEQSQQTSLSRIRFAINSQRLHPSGAHVLTQT